MKKTKLPSLVSILILTLLTALAWLSFSVFRALTIKPAPVVPAEISEPLTPTLDSATIESLRSKEFFEDFQIPEITTKEAPGRRGKEVVEEATPLPTPTDEIVESTEEESVEGVDIP